MAIIDVVKWDGTSDVLAWKFPSMNLSTYTQLIVNESQDAFLVSGGVYEGPFPAGRHTLATENLPVLRSLMKLPFGGMTPFSAEVWFVNRATNLDVKWGTPDPVQVQDPKFGVMLPVRAFGQYGVRISDAKRFLLKLVGTLPSFDASSLSDYFRGIFITRIKTLIANAIVKRGVSVLEITTELDELSQILQETMRAEVEEYGVEISKFRIMSINVDEADPAVARLKQALARRAEMAIVGFNYQQERSFDVLQSAASNEGTSGGVMGAGLGAGLGLGLGANIGNVMGGVMVPQPATPPTPPVPGPTSTVQGAPAGTTDLSGKVTLLKELAALRDQGVLTEEEFSREKAKILNS
jgi:membrane protease subunit (stomatin/prohibitin family)